jgi:hypothetical protein
MRKNLFSFFSVWTVVSHHKELEGKTCIIVERPGNNVSGDRIGEGGGEEGLQLQQAAQALLLLLFLPALCKNN